MMRMMKSEMNPHPLPKDASSALASVDVENLSCYKRPDKHPHV